jgi:hypothetical protein
MTSDKRKGWAWTIACVPAILWGIGQTGFFFEFHILIGALISMIGALIAGAMVGKTFAGKALYAVAYAAMGAGIAGATIWYTADRSSIINYELLIPIGIGCQPGVAIYLLVSRFIDAGHTETELVA